MDAVGCLASAARSLAEPGALNRKFEASFLGAGLRCVLPKPPENPKTMHLQWHVPPLC